MNEHQRSRRLAVVAVLCVVGAVGAVGAVPAESQPAESQSAESQPAEATVVQVLRDFEDGAIGDKRPVVVYWSWTPEQKAAAIRFSSLEIVGGSPFGERCSKLVVSEQLPQRVPGYRMVSLGVDYLPPESDAVRLRVKVLKGRFTIAVGGPTVYFGHSDVATQAVTLDAATHGEWSTVELSLNNGLTRNFRRSQWARNAPSIHYTRWIQEPLAIEVAAGSTGEMLIDQVELISHGQGRPYPAFEPAQIRTVGPSIDFEDPAAMEQAFTVMTNVTEQPDFEQAPHLVRKGWAPPRIARVAEGRTGRHSLEMVMTGTEEVCFAGLQILGTAEANAIALTIKAEYPGEGKPGVVLDFLAYAAPPEQRDDFPWDGLRPPPSWRSSPEIAYTYYLSPRNTVVEPASFGFYHIRRIVPNNQWVTLVLPLADFLCSYGQGAMLPAFQKQSPLAGDNVFALTFLSYFGQRSKPLRLLIDEVEFVTVPGTAEPLRSFYQTSVPD